MKKRSYFSLAFALAFAVAAPLAQATGSSTQSTTSSLVNGGSISNVVRSSASTTGTGSSYSAATGEAYSTNKGTTMTQKNPVCDCGAVSGAVNTTGQATSGVSGTAFNVSTGNGTGSASSVGSASSSLDTAAGYKGPGQDVKVNGSISQSANMSVIAAPNTGGAASAGNTGEYSVVGAVGSKTCTNSGICGSQVVNKEVWGSVTDVKGSTSFSNNGSMTVDGVVLPQAPTVSNATGVVNAGGSYYDPQ